MVDLEQRVEELEQKLEQLRDYVADKLEKKPTTRRVWTAEEVAFMKERYRQGPTSLCKMWNSKFGHDRTVDLATVSLTFYVVKNVLVLMLKI